MKRALGLGIVVAALALAGAGCIPVKPAPPPPPPPPPPPDLIVSALGVVPANPQAGQPTHFSATVTNQGGPTAAGVPIGVSFAVDGPQVTWATDQPGGLAQDASVVVATTGTPNGGAWTATAGKHTLDAYVDMNPPGAPPVNRIAESNENNNKRSMPFTVTPAGLPDLVVTALNASPAVPQSGQVTNFNATVKNQGTGPAPPGIPIGVSFGVDGPPVTWATFQTGGLAPGASLAISTTGTPNGGPWTATAGNHTLAAYVDMNPPGAPPVNRIAESNENNNKLAAPLNVAAKCGATVTANLTLTSDLTCSPPALTITAGVTVDLGWHTIGDPDTSHWSDEFNRPAIKVAADGATLRNGTIRGFATGTEGGGTIDHVTFLGNGVGVRDSAFDPFTLRPVRITTSTFDGAGTGGTGIVLDHGHDFGDIDPPTVLWANVGSSSFRNLGTGVDAFEWGGATIVGNEFTNSQYGLHLGSTSGFTIRNNDIGYGVYGIFMGQNVTHVISGNIIHDNRIGIGITNGAVQPGGSLNITIAANRLTNNDLVGLLESEGKVATNVVIDRNNASGNGSGTGAAPYPFTGTASLDDGIHIEAVAGSSITVSNNTVFSNADRGIQATGAIDGGGNHGALNGGSPQCLGIACP